MNTTSLNNNNCDKFQLNQNTSYLNDANIIVGMTAAKIQKRSFYFVCWNYLKMNNDLSNLEEYYLVIIGIQCAEIVTKSGK